MSVLLIELRAQQVEMDQLDQFGTVPVLCMQNKR
jgi:hypothetical protein